MLLLHYSFSTISSHSTKRVWIFVYVEQKYYETDYEDAY